MPERTAPPTWVTDGEREWIGWLEAVGDDGKAIVVDALGGRVAAAASRTASAPPRDWRPTRRADASRPVRRWGAVTHGRAR